MTMHELKRTVQGSNSFSILFNTSSYLTKITLICKTYCSILRLIMFTGNQQIFLIDAHKVQFSDNSGFQRFYTFICDYDVFIH
jgi:hypothetical protein